MRFSRGHFRYLVALAAALCCGCQLVPAGQFNTVNSQNKALSEQNRALTVENENLRYHSHQNEDKLIQAEEQLALLDQKSGADSKRLANFQKERHQLRDQFASFSHDGVKIPQALSAQLSDLARKYPTLQFDPQTGVAKIDSDVVFDSGSADLKPPADTVLADLADTLQSDEAKEMRIMVVGHTDNQKIAGKETRQRYADNLQLSTARAKSVADYLHKSGIPERRLGIAGFGGQQPIAPNTSSNDRHRNRRVEIFIIPPEVPIVGWPEASTSLY